MPGAALGTLQTRCAPLHAVPGTPHLCAGPEHLVRPHTTPLTASWTLHSPQLTRLLCVGLGLGAGDVRVKLACHTAGGSEAAAALRRAPHLPPHCLLTAASEPLVPKHLWLTRLLCCALLRSADPHAGQARGWELEMCQLQAAVARPALLHSADRFQVQSRYSSSLQAPHHAPG